MPNREEEPRMTDPDNDEINRRIRAAGNARRSGYPRREPEPVGTQVADGRAAGSFDGGARLVPDPPVNPNDVMNARLRSRPLRDPYGDVVGTYDVAEGTATYHR
jgi:hypothetical protein